MYGWIWRHLPGPWVVRFIIALALVAGVFYLLMEVVFPQISLLMPYNEVSV